MPTPRQKRIHAVVLEHLQPEYLEIQDESHMHSVPAGGESHIKLIIVSDTFTGEPLIQRHRRIQGLLREEFSRGLHALAIHAWTTGEWSERGHAAPPSPKCRGGSTAAVAPAQQPAELGVSHQGAPA